jgi:hypothetical protein
MAAYTPLNINVFSAAFAGAMAGIPSSGAIVDIVAADYANYALIASTFAQAVDISWGATAATQTELNSIQLLSALFWDIRNPSPSTLTAYSTVGTYTGTANAIKAATQAGTTQLTANQITAPAGSPGGNRAYGSGAATTAGQATITVIAAAKLIARGSGVFKAWCNFSYAAAAATDVVTVTMKTLTDAVAGTPLTLGAAGSIGFGSNGVAQPGNVAVNNNGAFTANNGSGITIAGAAAAVTVDTKVETIGTAAVGMFFAWENEVGVALAVTGNENPVPVGQTCLVTMSITNAGAARATGNVVIGMFEM